MSKHLRLCLLAMAVGLAVGIFSPRAPAYGPFQNGNQTVLLNLPELSQA